MLGQFVDGNLDSYADWIEVRIALRKSKRFQQRTGILTILSMIFLVVSPGIAAETLPNPTLLKVLKGHGDVVNSVAFHPMREELFSGGSDAQLIRWNFGGMTAKHDATLPSAYWEINRVQFGDRIAALGFDRSGDVAAGSGVTRWNSGVGSKLQVMTKYRPKPYVFRAKARGSFSCLAIEPRGRFIAMGAKNNELKVVSLLPKMGV